MKKKWLLIPALALLFGGALALSITSVKVSQVRAEEIAEVIEEEKEDESKYQELLQKLNEVKDSQVVTTIISVLSGGGCGALLALGPMFVNRGTINKAKSVANTSANELEVTAKNMKELKDQLDINSKLYDDGIKKVEEASKVMYETSHQMELLEKNQEAMAKKHQEDIEFFLTIIGSSKELVANGTAELLNKRFGK
jgi:hypothetical protein